MEATSELTKRWVTVGAVAGLLACTVYPLLITVSMPMALTVFLAGAFGPLLAVASIGLYHFLAIHRKTVSAQIAVTFNVIAGTVVNLMLIVQMAVHAHMRETLQGAEETTRETLTAIFTAVDKVQLGLDVSWDIFVSVGTILFAVNMLRHPRLGAFFFGTGMLIGAGLLVLNLATFPTPPADAELFDLGPAVGLWYFVVCIWVLRSLKWVRASSSST
jgi:hypothetical protein